MKESDVIASSGRGKGADSDVIASAIGRGRGNSDVTTSSDARLTGCAVRRQCGYARPSCS